MPHIIVHHPVGLPGNARLETLLDQLHRTVVGTGLFDESHIKLRTLPFVHFRNGGQQGPYLHIELRIKPGRSKQQKTQLSQIVLQTVREEELQVDTITVEVVEMDADSYAKWQRD